MRKRIFDIIEVLDPEDDDFIGMAYDWVVLIAVLASLVPLAFKTDYPVFHIIDKVTVSIFIVDYILRLITADYKMGKKGFASFVKYPFTPRGCGQKVGLLKRGNINCIQEKNGLKQLNY